MRLESQGEREEGIDTAQLKWSARQEGNRNFSGHRQARRWFQYQAARVREVTGSVFS